MLTLSLLTCTESFFLTFFCSPTFALSICDLYMGGVFTKWEYHKSPQPRAQVCPMAEWLMLPCHSEYGETASVERTISLLDFLTAPSTSSKNEP
jgi:hypothetical protein